MKFTDVYPQFLNTLKSETLAGLSDEEIINYLDTLMIRAIADFSFPYKSLAYEKDIEGDYAFTGDITQREINVLIVMIKSFWLEQQLDNEGLFEVAFYDKDVKTFSMANKIKVLQTRFADSKKDKKSALSNYYAEKDGDPFLSTIYDG